MATFHCKQWHNPWYLQHSVLSLEISHQTWQQLFEVGIVFCIQNIWNGEALIYWGASSLNTAQAHRPARVLLGVGGALLHFQLSIPNWSLFLKVQAYKIYERWVAPREPEPKTPKMLLQKTQRVLFFKAHWCHFSGGRRWFRILLLLYLQFTKSGLKSTAPATIFRPLLPFSCYVNIQGKKIHIWLLYLVAK